MIAFILIYSLFVVCSNSSTCNNNGYCNASGLCECYHDWNPPSCSDCQDGWYPAGSCNIRNFLLLSFFVCILLTHQCTDCIADTSCNKHGECSALGECICDPAYNGSSSCNECGPNHYDYPSCTCMKKRGRGAPIITLVNICEQIAQIMVRVMDMVAVTTLLGNAFVMMSTVGTQFVLNALQTDIIIPFAHVCLLLYAARGSVNNS